MGYKAENKYKMRIDKNKLDEYIQKAGYSSYRAFFDELKEDYELGVDYKNFMALVYGYTNWYLIYADAILDKLNIDYKELFYKEKIT
ncbi:MAG: hypothetical protein ACOCUI_03135 [bacterium]